MASSNCGSLELRAAELAAEPARCRARYASRCRSGRVLARCSNVRGLACGELSPPSAVVRCAAWLVICLVALAGCTGGNRRPIKPVTVTLKYKGAPVEGATVTFISDEPDAPPAFGKTDAQGVAKPATPELGNGVVLGTHKILVSKEQIVNEKKAADQESLDYAPGVTPVPQVKHLVPVKYNAPGTTTLTAEVTKEGPSEFTFELTD